MSSHIGTMSIWLMAIRPRTLVASVSPVLIGNALALKKGVFSPNIFFLTFVFSLLIQIGTNLTNDYYDFLKGADNANRKGPQRVMQMGLVSESAMKAAIFFVFLSSLALGFLMTLVGGATFLCLSMMAIIFGLCYTAGPFPLAYLGLGDIFVLVFFGPVAVMGCNYLQTYELTFACFLAGLGPGLFSCAILNANNIRDTEEDRAARKLTLAVRFGKKFAIYEYIVCAFTALLIPILLFFYGHTSKIAFANIALLALLIEPIKGLFSNNDQQIALVLPQTAHIMTLYALIFPLSILM